MERLLKELTLDNGLVLEVTDESSNYYADFWNLKIVIRGKVEVAPRPISRQSSQPTPLKRRPGEPWDARWHITGNSPG